MHFKHNFEKLEVGRILPPGRAEQINGISPLDLGFGIEGLTISLTNDNHRPQFLLRVGERKKGHKAEKNREIKRQFHS